MPLPLDILPKKSHLKLHEVVPFSAHKQTKFSLQVEHLTGFSAKGNLQFRLSSQGNCVHSTRYEEKTNPTRQSTPISHATQIQTNKTLCYTMPS